MKTLTQEQHNTISQFQSYVDQFIPTGYLVKGYETIQRKANDIIAQLRADLSDGYDAYTAEKLAKMEIDELIPYAKGIR